MISDFRDCMVCPTGDQLITRFESLFLIIPPLPGSLDGHQCLEFSATGWAGRVAFEGRREGRGQLSQWFQPIHKKTQMTHAV